MTDDISDAPAGFAKEQLRQFIERICRLHGEKDAVQGDIKDVYAEAHSAGFDKTALGAVVTRLRKRAKDASKFDEQETLVDLYLSAVDPSHTYARARE